MRIVTQYEGENGQRYTTKEEAEAALIRGITSRLNLLHVARGRLYETPEKERKAMLLGEQGNHGRTLAQWCEQMQGLLGDLADLQHMPAITEREG